MELTKYVTDLREQLLLTAEAAEPSTQQAVEQLLIAMDAAVRLVLLEALSEAASEITSELAPGSVALQLQGREPEFAVDLPTDLPTQARTPPPRVDPDDGGLARLTLRMPESLKTRVEAAAASENISVNTWLVRAVTGAVAPTIGTASRPSTTTQRVTGWSR